ncbi:MAG: dihydroneopterin aldolase, partial [Alphaproteobacteria bacterium]
MLDYKIHLKNIRVMMSLGIHPDEKKYHQAVLMDIALTCQKPSGFFIQAVVDYDTLSTAIIELCQARHFDLLEELAEVIANHRLALPW